MQLQLAELLLLLMWGTAGLFILISTLTNHPKLWIPSLFAIENRWGKFLIGLTLLGLVFTRVLKWCTSTNPTIYWGL